MSDRNQMVALAILSGAMLPACGDDPASTCGKVQPCGGNVVGNYNITAACTTRELSAPDVGFNCPEATVSAPSLNVAGSASFDADLGFTWTTMSSATVSVTFPPSCLAPQTGGITLTCAQINDLVPLLIASMPDTIQAATCGGSGETCTCTVTTVTQTISESGTYAASGTSMTLNRTDGSVASLGTCAKGDELHLISLDMTMPMTILSDSVLTKR